MPRPLPCLLQVTGICQDKTLALGNFVFGSGFSLSQSHFPIHSGLVTFQKGDVVSLDQKVRHLQLAVGGSLKGVLGFPQAAQELIVESKLQIPTGKSGSSSIARLATSTPFSYLPKVGYKNAPKSGYANISRG